MGQDSGRAGGGATTGASGTGPVAGGRRRIDRVLGEEFLADLAQLDLEEVRSRRREAEQEDADLSYVRRLLQGRADILRAELDRRAAGAATQPGAEDDRALVERLTGVLTDPRRGDHGLGRFLSVDPSRVGEHRRHVEQVVADVGVTELVGAEEEQLRAALQRLGELEADLSANRRRVQAVMDTLTAEVARRYRDGEARVDDLLAGS